jgi:hypothetical protein
MTNKNLPAINKKEKRAEYWCCVMSSTYVFLFFPFLYFCFTYSAKIHGSSVFFCRMFPLLFPVTVYFIQKKYRRGEYEKMYFYCLLPILICFMDMMRFFSYIMDAIYFFRR